MEMKGQHEAILRKFYTQDLFNSPEFEGADFSEKFTGYLLIYAPYYIHFFETDADDDLVNLMLGALQRTVGKKIHEQIWVLHDTEEVPDRAFT